jgi:hypothetical protein
MISERRPARPATIGPERGPDAEARRYRAGRRFELVLFDRLPTAEQVALGELLFDADLYGVLKPRTGEHGTIKVVNRDTALLLFALGEPGPLPRFASAGSGEAAERSIADLVMDGVLEVEVEGRFVAGAGAARALGLAAEAKVESCGGGRLRALATAALRYAAALPIDDAEELAARLYGYHRLPVTSAWEARLAGRDATLRFLAGESRSSLRRELDRRWSSADEPETEGWIAWSPRGEARRHATRSTHKLYVSPSPESAPDAFAAVVATLLEHGQRPFKVGLGAAGLLRPDKLVVYFGELEDLLAVSSKLQGRLAGIAAHGVPFSAAIDAEGLLSWGMDPPRSAARFSWHERESWRLWLVRRLAAALLAARAGDPDGMAPWEFALARLRREGIDVDRWLPTSGLWLDERGE